MAVLIVQVQSGCETICFFLIFPCIFPSIMWQFYIHFDFLLLLLVSKSFFFLFISLSQFLLKVYRDLQCTLSYYLISVVSWTQGWRKARVKSREEQIKCTSRSPPYGVIFFSLEIWPASTQFSVICRSKFLLPVLSGIKTVMGNMLS